MKKQDQLDNSQLSDFSISYPRSYVSVTGSVASSVFLSQLVSWSKCAQDTDGWILKKSEEWQTETGLGRYEQKTARKILTEKNLMEEALGGKPARLSFRLNTDELAKLLPAVIKGVENNKQVVNPVFNHDVGSDNQVVQSVRNQHVTTSKLVISQENKDAENNKQAVKMNSQQHSNDVAMQIDLQKFQRLESSFAKMVNQLDAKLVRIEKQLGAVSKLEREIYSRNAVFEVFLWVIAVSIWITLLLCIWIWQKV